jgi:hypothetical protein
MIATILSLVAIALSGIGLFFTRRSARASVESAQAARTVADNDSARLREETDAREEAAMRARSASVRLHLEKRPDLGSMAGDPVGIVVENAGPADARDVGVNPVAFDQTETPELLPRLALPLSPFELRPGERRSLDLTGSLDTTRLLCELHWVDQNGPHHIMREPARLLFE